MLSVVVLTKNEEQMIQACLESVNWVDEIVVIDNASSDKTKDIAKKYTKSVYSYKDTNFSSLRNKGMEKTTKDWVLFVDADERVMQPLKEEINDLIQTKEYVAYALPRNNIILGKKVSYGPYKNDWVIRLVKRSGFKEWVGEVHEYMTFEGKLGYANHPLLHLTHRNLDQIILKSVEWSKIDADLRIAAGHPPMTQWRFLRILITELWQQGIIRKGFFNGTIGTIDAILQTFSLFMTYVRLWQMQQGEPLEKVYKNIDKKLLEDDFTSL